MRLFYRCETEMSQGENSNNIATGQKEQKRTKNGFNFVGCTNASS